METTDSTKQPLLKKYDLLAKKFRDAYVDGKNRGSDAISEALETAHKQMLDAEEFTVEQGQELKQYLLRDLDQTVADFEHLGDEAKDKLNPSRLGVGVLASLASVLEAAETALHSLTEKTNKKLSYKSGEITSAGTLTCQSCGQTLHLKATGHVPPCPKCKASQFKKGY
jgi:isocitrate dehydrogenase